MTRKYLNYRQQSNPWHHEEGVQFRHPHDSQGTHGNPWHCGEGMQFRHPHDSNNTIKRKQLSLPPGRVAQSVTCLATDECLTADLGVASSIPARYHTFVEIDHEIISTVILLPSAD